jgi:autotransporter-associated beta strand protein
LNVFQPKSKHRHIAFSIVAAVAAWFLIRPVGAQPYIPGNTYFDRSNYIEYVAGDLPVIFSAPHGGALTPAEIPDRVDDGSDPDFTTVTDSYTEETALAVQSVFASYFGHSPHVIICQLKRTKIDCNRSLDEGVYQTNTFATIAWNDFQNYINVASNSAAAQSGRGFYIDLHGQGHAIQRLELGYLLTARQLTNTDTVLNQPTYAAQSSIRSLATLVSNKLSMPFSQILRGTNSFGGMMEARGYPSVPDPDMPNPGNGTNPIVYPGINNDYFDGGYNTAVHASQTGAGPVDGLQIEANMTGVRDTAVDRTNYAIAIAQTLDYFFTNYYGFDLRLSAPCIWSIGAGKWAKAANWSNGIVPVAGNYLLFNGPGGAVSNNLAALTTGTGRIYSLLYATNAGGSYTNYGNPVSLVAGITNFSAFSQNISNTITLLAPQTFSAASGTLNFFGNVTNGGFNLSLIAATNLAVNGVISGTGGLKKSGGGNVRLNSANNFSGGTFVLAGALLVNNANGSGTGTGSVIISNTGTLGGNGAISGVVMCAGVIFPGQSAGVLTIGGGLDLSAGGTNVWELSALNDTGAGTNFDQLVLTGGNLALGGSSRLQISFIGSATVPSNTSPFWMMSHTWKIISLAGTATNAGATKFPTILSGSYNTGTFTNTTDAAGNVLLSYVATPAAKPVVQFFAPVAPGAFSLTCSAETNRTCILQSTTDLSSANWVAVSTNVATAGTLNFTNIASGDPMRFYRLAVVP